MKKQSFLYGASILAIASILCKIMSAVFKIPLDRFFLHEDGIAVYQSAYSIYNVFLAICVTGIPIALSSLVAKSGDDEAASLCKSTLVFVTYFTTVCAVILAAFSGPLARLLSGGGEQAAQPSLIILALSLPAMGIISSRRGYFQGMGNMTPSAISQLTESLVKVVLGISICALTVGRGISFGAAGAICGVALGALASAFVLELFFRKNVKIKADASFKKAMTVLKISVPMTLGAFGFTAVLLTDTLTVPKILAMCGEGYKERLSMFGYLTRANTVYNLPATVITALTASAVPSIAAAVALGDKEKQSESICRAIKLIFLIAIPCMLGMVLFSKEILNLLYGTSNEWELIALAGFMALIMPYIQTTTAMLQTMDRVWIPIIVSMTGVVMKALLNFVLIKLIGIEGAMVSTIAVFTVVFIINTVLIMRTVRLKGLGKILIRLSIVGIISCGSARLLYGIREGFIMLVVCVGIAAAIYLCGIILTGCIKKEEFFR